jgi:hypothetical protein
MPWTSVTTWWLRTCRCNGDKAELLDTVKAQLDAEPP